MIPCYADHKGASNHSRFKSEAGIRRRGDGRALWCFGAISYWDCHSTDLRTIRGRSIGSAPYAPTATAGLARISTLAFTPLRRSKLYFHAKSDPQELLHEEAYELPEQLRQAVTRSTRSWSQAQVDGRLVSPEPSACKYGVAIAVEALHDNESK